jgi:UDP-2,3-diacylglucosamine hydrolase
LSEPRLAIFSGAGELPYLAAETARSQNRDHVIYHIVEATLDDRLATDKIRTIRTISLGEIAKTFSLLKEDKISQMVLLGKIEKQRMLQDVKRDATAEEIYAAAPDRRDDSLFLQFAAGIHKMGIEILPQKELLPDCFLKPGTYAAKTITSEALSADIEFGLDISRKIGSLDIGQTAIIFEKMILAVEAIEGTDAAIRRAGAIARGRGGVVCKTGKASQDPRFDLPAVGLQTLETMAEVGMQALAIDAAQTLVVNPEEFLSRADELGITVIAC